ncbi:SDR family NAD(P)-dependent oxidoreductase [Alterisphingorhabdus coralli]|uniref:SDR family NAD(P)-dependent oxidoreductase n=1 Tax=Alterisphingorhabdus coralli TaxID=3071408 RepID=A0AA97HZZ8_9SPHN|nr:SDR family NAD(P)-dependent oxidoreductase [Parasphingorhabdus sp. SCSIO 66989]WOE75274.1 SDR family NAD(P)-dependent oxidoreductase [Parasphingorhabdus sp. SCSIO 66989]
MDVQGKTIVITGGATGLGFALAKRLGAEGARILLCEPREERLQQACEALGEAGVDAKYLVGDVTKAEDMTALADFAWGENGRADMFIANAGVGGGRQFAFDMDMAEARALFEVNFWGVWSGISEFGKRMVADGQPGAVYAVASENALFNAIPMTGSAYVASKHAVLGLMEVMRRDAPENITTGVIMPGWVQSELTDWAQDLAMPADQFADIIVPQLLAGEFYCVSHAYNVERMRERWDAVYAAFDRYAPRYDGDAEYDVQLAFAKMQAKDGE